MKYNDDKRLNNWKGRVMHGQYLRQTEDIDNFNTRKWLRKTKQKRCTEALICTAQEEALRRNYVKFHIYKAAESPLWNVCRRK